MTKTMLQITLAAALAAPAFAATSSELLKCQKAFESNTRAFAGYVATKAQMRNLWAKTRHGFFGQRNVPHQCFRQLTHFWPLCQQRNPSKRREAIRRCLGVAALTFLHDQPR